MEALRSYLTTAMLASVASAICIQLTDDRYRKYVKYVAGLGLLLTLALPLKSIVAEASDFEWSLSSNEEASLTGNSEYIELLGSEMARSIGDRVAYLFDLPREAVYVTLTLDTSEADAIEIVSIEISVTEKCNATAIEQAVAKEFACAVEVWEVSGIE